MERDERHRTTRGATGIVAAVAAATLFACGPNSPSPVENSPAPPPNVLVILVDDLGYMDIGANNPDTFYETPNIDALAAQGLRFTDGYAANPVCSPTRYSIMTGKYPTRVGATNWFSGELAQRFLPAELNDRMPLDEITIGQAMRDAGYATFFGGKWHLGPTPEYWPDVRGFDVNAGGHERGGPYGPGRYFTPYGNPRLDDGLPGEHLPARLAQETVDFIRDRGDRPFFAYLAFYSVHTPLMAPEPLVAKYRDKAAHLGLEGSSTFGVEEQVWPDAEERRVRTLQTHAVYSAMVESMDSAVGVVLDALAEEGLADDTVVFLTSDNGGLSTSEGLPTSNLPLRGGKGWLYEGGIREPFIARWPGVTIPGSLSAEPVMSMDLYPTLLEVAGAEPRPGQVLDGGSLVPLLRGQSGPVHEALFWHYPHYSNQGGFPGGAVRVGDWKLIERYEDGRVHLYDLATDPGEQHDLGAEHPDRIADLRARLHAWYEQVGAQFLRAQSGGPDPWRPR